MDTIVNGWVIEENIFDEPTGTSVRGVVTAFVPAPARSRRSGRVRIAHAFLEVDKPPAITLEVPKLVALEDLDVISKAFTAFRERVAELDTGRGEVGNG